MFIRASVDPVAELAVVVTEERERIARLWSKRLSLELHEVEARTRDLRRPLLELVTQLGRLLSDRGEDAIRLWAEVVRAHGADRYDMRFEPEDLARELKALHLVLLRVYERRRGLVEPEVAELLAELIGEASASVHASYARVMRTEESRLHETAVMESVLHNVDIGILLAELNGRVSYATPPVSQLFGLPARVLTGVTAESLRTVLLQLNARRVDGAAFRPSEMPWVVALKEQREVKGVVMVIHRITDGAELYLEMNAMPVYEEGTKVLLGAVQTIVDRTEDHQKERELTEAYQQLRGLQGRLLQRTRAQALGQLASGAAHNLNNFLNVIRLRLTLLRRGYKPEYLDALDRTVGNITELVDRLQDFASQRGGEEELSAASVNSVVREGLDLARSELHRGDHPIQVDDELTEDALTRVDAIALRELLVNLLLWSRGRMPEGGKVTIDSATPEGFIELTLRDTGRPYEQEELIRLFDPLKGKTPAPQLALLLAVGRNQVQRWGGELWAENNPDGEGAAFRLRLPVLQPSEVAAPAEQAETVQEERQARTTSARRGQTRRVLLVDDEPENARMMAEVLTDEGYEVCVATTGEDALRMWKGSHFDAALLDGLLPDISGWSIAREIRKDYPHALLAVVTGGDVRGQSRDNLAQVDAVFRKPIDVGALDDFLSQTGGPTEVVVGPPTETLH